VRTGIDISLHKGTIVTLFNAAQAPTAERGRRRQREVAEHKEASGTTGKSNGESPGRDNPRRRARQKRASTWTDAKGVSAIQREAGTLYSRDSTSHNNR